MDWRATLAGLVVGALIGITGMGGGSIMTPLLILGLGVPPLQAVASGLVYSAATTLAGATEHVRLRTVDLRLAALLAVGSVPMSVVGVMILSYLAADAPVVQRQVRFFLGAALVALAVLFVMRPALDRALVRRARPAPPPWVLSAGGAIIGMTTGLTSVGSGSLTTGLLSLTTIQHARTRVGTVLFHSTVLTLAAGMAHLALGRLNTALTLSLLAGSLPGVVLGSRLTVRVPERALCLGQAWMLLVLGGLLCVSSGAWARPARDAGHTPHSPQPRADR